MSEKKEENDDLVYFLATKEGRDFIVFCKQEQFILKEQEILNLIKICLVNKRAIEIGNKIRAIYETANEHRIETAKENLKRIGITENEKARGEKLRTKTR